MIVKHCSRQERRSVSGRSVTLTYLGSLDDVLQMNREHLIGEVTEDGTLVDAFMRQEAGAVWAVELEYSSTADGSSVEPPDTSYGAKSLSLHGSLLSLSLETAPKYKMCWNHYLAAEPGTSAVPAWWATAKTAVDISGGYAQTYAWIKSLAEVPIVGEKRWHVLKDPLYIGLESRDMATWSVTESIRVRTMREGFVICGRMLNRIVAPVYAPPAQGNWKCDDATVTWSGKCWIVTLSYTLSGTASGWIQDIYDRGSV